MIFSMMVSYLMCLKDKVVIIIGVGGVIGFEILVCLL